MFQSHVNELVNLCRIGSPALAAIVVLYASCVLSVHSLTYGTENVVKIPECPTGSALLTRANPNQLDTANRQIPVRCLPHQTGLCIDEIMAQNISATTENICCWFNKVDYFCCANMTVACPDYKEKTVILRNPFHGTALDSQPAKAAAPTKPGAAAGQAAAAVGYGRRRRAIVDVSDADDLDDTPSMAHKIVHRSRGVGGYAWRRGPGPDDTLIHGHMYEK